mmetsp:Transcript_1333/g.4621  ORF Transcript_1333/g.4621 Transcript_1333/m.4621 type:complete len:392 (+) Transcript_1333:108-1283(+)|eukprot:scaffold3100_cov403-Prasinococcus_capsulatus_cf.AAC.2
MASLGKALPARQVALRGVSPSAESSVRVQATRLRPARKTALRSVAVAAPQEKAVKHLAPEKVEIFTHLEPWAEEELLPLLKSVDTNWQPADFLPDSASDTFEDEVRELRKRTAELPDEYLVGLVGDMITEEALPTYQTMLNTLDGTKDETGASQTAWARWTRAWTAEENRHGDLLNKYLYLTGRVDMKSIERTIQYLIGSGMDPGTDNNPYLGFMYTSFQERATKVSHSNTAKHAKHYGEDQLSKVCGIIAADEGRHETAYCKIVEKLFELDPNDTMLGFEDMMRKQIVMPAHLMYDGENENLWTDFSSVAEHTGVYTAFDYADIMEHLIQYWDLENKSFTGDAQRGQEYVCKLPPRIRKLAERSMSKAKKAGPRTGRISWVYNREVQLQL